MLQILNLKSVRSLRTLSPYHPSWTFVTVNWPNVAARSEIGSEICEKGEPSEYNSEAG